MRDLPDDFSPGEYLLLNPDVEKAGVDPTDHYRRYGALEGRPYRRPRGTVAQSIADRFIMTAPSPQNIVDLFEGEWSTAMPEASGLVSSPGRAQLFNDDRIHWAADWLGPFVDRTLLELGPLEGAHSFMLQQYGAKEVISVEANAGAFLRCLCVKEIFGLDRVRFRLGDFGQYLAASDRQFDAIIACGVLYHLTDPVALLQQIAAHTDKVMLWTHYYDKLAILDRADRHLFVSDRGVDQLLGKYRGVRKLYAQEALDWKGFSGGVNTHAIWLEQASILNFFRDAGFGRIEVKFDQKDHPNGPAFAVCAERVSK
ncbi:MAG: class I SAM-dependent methyltransferase [Hyphomicrobiales bacterium]|nr:MAG: class I SAM-dependent methyltransferase [Hyphomicrobiales bacterium]